MQITVKENRSVLVQGFAGTQNENKATMFNVVYPEKFTDFNKQIVFITSDGVFCDNITDDTYTIKNNITKYKRVKGYILFFNSDGVDFRSAEFTLNFNENHLVDAVLDEEQVNILQTLITKVDSLISTVELKIEEVEGLKEEITLNKDYENLENKPSIEGIELLGNKTFEELGIASVKDLSSNDYTDEEKEKLAKIVDSLPEVLTSEDGYYLSTEDEQVLICKEFDCIYSIIFEAIEKIQQN